MNIEYEKVMEILEKVYTGETESALCCMELMAKTINPIKRLSYKRSYKRFRNQCFGIRLAIDRIKYEFES